MAGKIIADTLETGAGADISTSYVVNGSTKAWILFSMSAGTVTDDVNFSSITDDGTGVFTLSFSSAMANATYVTTASGSDESSGPTTYVQDDGDTKTSSQVKVRAINRSGTAVDSVKWEGAVHGDLA